MPDCPPAFTLVEVLVASAVLALMVLMVIQLVGGVSRTTNLQRQQLDADRQARLVFDRMAADFANMVRRADVDCSAYSYPNYRTGTTAHFKRAGNDSILFFSEADSQTSGSSVAVEDEISLVGYRVFDNPATADSTDASFKLERLGRAFGYSEPATTTAGFGLPFLTFQKLTDPNTTDPTQKYQVVTGSTITGYFSGLDAFNTAGQSLNGIAESHVLGQDVFRMEFALLMKDADPTTGSYYLPSSANVAYLDYTKTRQRAFSGVNAIVVTIAVLDQQSRQRLGDSNLRYQAMNAAAGKLVDGDDASVASIWARTLASDTSLPRVFATNAYVYQRYFYLR